MLSSCANFRDAASALLEHLGEPGRVEVALVEQALGGLDDGGDDPGLRDDPAHRANGPAADALRDLADLELELRRAGERVAALIHRRRAGVCGLAAEGDLVALDAEGAEHHPERQVEGLEHRALLDVELEIRRRALELRPRLERAVEVDAVLGERVRQRDAVRVAALAQLVLVAHRAGGRRGAEERAAEAGTLLVGPVDEPHGQRRRAFLGDPAQHLDARDDVEGAVEPAAVRDGVDVAADQERPLGGARQREPLVAGLVDLFVGAGRDDLLAQPLARALPRLGPRDALRAVLVAGQLPQLAQLRDGPFR